MVILFVILFRKHIHRFPLAYFRPFPFIELKNLMRVGLPSAGEQLSYSSSQVVITFFINMLGVEALATRTYCVNIIMFVYLFSISMAQGGAICIGHLIGEKKPHAAFLLGKYVMKKSVMITLILSGIIAASGHAILSWLTSNPEIIRMGVIVLLIDVVLEIGRPINIFATNALRAAGDVNYPFYVGLVVMWSVAVGIGYLFGIYRTQAHPLQNGAGHCKQNKADYSTNQQIDKQRHPHYLNHLLFKPCAEVLRAKYGCSQVDHLKHQKGQHNNLVDNSDSGYTIVRVTAQHNGVHRSQHHNQ